MNPNDPKPQGQPASGNLQFAEPAMGSTGPNMGVTLDEAQVRQGLHMFVTVAGPIAAYIPKVGPILATLLPYLDTEEAAKLLVFLAALPDHIQIKALQDALDAAKSAAGSTA